MNVVILGCGFTGERVARRFLNRGAGVIVTTRHPARLQHLAARGAIVRMLDATESAGVEIPSGALVLHSIPVAGAEDTTPRMLAGSQPARVVYLSTTGVYGNALEVNDTTPASPLDESSRQRIAAEDYVEAGPWSSLILRPAAIYGPGRGIHVRIQRQDFSLAGDGSSYVSRIHVDDLAAHIEAALLSRVTGRFPVADAEPCTGREIAEFCAALLGVEVPAETPRENLHPTRRANRRVDGSAIRLRLAVELKYPSYKVGIPAALEGESNPQSMMR